MENEIKNTESAIRSKILDIRGKQVMIDALQNRADFAENAQRIFLKVAKRKCLYFHQRPF